MTNQQVRSGELIDKLRKRGNRITPQRIAVLKVLLAGGEHPSVEQIYEHVRVNFPTTSIASVYKTVQLLKEVGEVLELEFSDGSRYDGNRPYPHPHLVCVRCGKITDFEVPTLSELPQKAAQETGYKIMNHRLDLYGICPQCQRPDSQEVKTERREDLQIG